VLLNDTIVELPVARDLLIGAACNLGAADLRERLAAWHALRDEAVSIDALDDAIRLRFPEDHPLTEMTRLVDLESECCPFYRFTIRVAGADRALEVDAGQGRLPAVRALLGLPG
jgi:MerR family copper efflux transcriptional regulator